MEFIFMCKTCFIFYLSFILLNRENNHKRGFPYHHAARTHQIKQPGLMKNRSHLKLFWCPSEMSTLIDAFNLQLYEGIEEGTFVSSTNWFIATTIFILSTQGQVLFPLSLRLVWPLEVMSLVGLNFTWTYSILS